MKRSKMKMHHRTFHSKAYAIMWRGQLKNKNKPQINPTLTEEGLS